MLIYLATDKELTVTPTLAPEADMSLPKIINPAEDPTGHKAFQRIYQALPTSHTGLRPYISARGATRNGANPRPRKKTENAIWPPEGSMCKSRRMSSNAGATILADINVMSGLPEHTTPTLTFRSNGQLNGFSGSSTPSQVT